MPTLDDYRAAAELRSALRRFAGESERITRDVGLTPQRYQLLLMIEASAGTATVSSLQEALQLGQSGVTQLVQRAEALGLLERHAIPGDARSQRLVLTRAGGEILAEAFTRLGPERERLAATLTELRGQRHV